MSDEQNEQNIYTCSDGVRISISDKAEQISGNAKFHDYLDSREEFQDYLTNGTLMGWQDFYVEARFRTLKGEDQIREEVAKRRLSYKTPEEREAYQQERLDTLYGPEED